MTCAIRLPGGGIGRTEPSSHRQDARSLPACYNGALCQSCRRSSESGEQCRRQAHCYSNGWRQGRRGCPAHENHPLVLPEFAIFANFRDRRPRTELESKRAARVAPEPRVSLPSLRRRCGDKVWPSIRPKSHSFQAADTIRLSILTATNGDKSKKHTTPLYCQTFGRTLSEPPQNFFFLRVSRGPSNLWPR